MKMLERAARGMFDATPFREEGPYEAQTDAYRRMCVLLAAATIRSIREPDEEVLLAMAIFLMGERTASVTHARALAKAIWQAGIDKITEDRG